MSSVEQIVSKGYYSHSQIEEFLSVKNYIFVRDRQKKYLLIRLSNLSDFTANSIEFSLTQLDSTGAVLEKTTHKFDGLTFHPGRVLTLPQSIPVDEFCTDFKLQFSCVTSGNFVYRVQGKSVSVHYTPAVSHDPFVLDPVRTVWTASVKPLKQGKRLLAVLCGTLALVLLFGLGTYRMFARYQKAIEADEHKTSSHQTQTDRASVPFRDSE